MLIIFVSVGLGLMESRW